MAKNHADVLKKLIPISLGEDFDTHLELMGDYLDDARDNLDLFIDELFGDTATVETLGMWERMLALTPEPGDSVATRRNAIVAQIRAQGGQSRQYFIDLMAAFGETVVITEYDPPRAGVARVGVARVYPAEIIFAWHMEFTGWTGNTRQEVVENLINKLKPAHTMVSFTYN